MQVKFNFKKLYNFIFFSFIFIFMFVGSIYAQPTTHATNDLSNLISYVCCCLYWPIYLILCIYSAFWIYKDAKRLNINEPILWAVLSLLFFPLIFFIYYFIERKDAKSKLNSLANSSNLRETINSNSGNSLENTVNN